MKKLLLVLIAIPTFAFSADFMTAKLNVLQIRKYRTVSGQLELRFIRENPRIVMRVGHGNKATHDFFLQLMKSDVLKVNCDGDFFPLMDNSLQPYIHVNSLKSCLDEDGEVVAHSIGIKALSDAEVAVSKKFVEDNLKASPLPLSVNDSNKPKENTDSTAGVFSSRLRIAQPR